MGDVKYWDGNYGKTLDDLEGHVSAAERGSGEQRDDSIGAATQTVRRLQGIKRSYNLEIKLMRDPATKGHYANAKAEKDGRLEELVARLEAAKAKAAQGADSGQRSELFSGRTEAAGAGGAAAAAAAAGAGGRPTPEQKLDQADRIQDKTEAAYQNMIQVLGDSEAVAADTAQELRDQRDQINRVTEDVIEIDSLLGRADKLVKVFSKRMMTDKFIQCFGCLNVLVLVSIVIYVVVDNVGLPGSEPSTPPDPTTV